MKKSRLLSLLLSAVMAFSAVPAISVSASDIEVESAATKPAVYLAEGVNALADSVTYDDARFAEIGKNNYLRVTEIVQKNEGIRIDLPKDIVLGDGDIYKLSFKLRPATIAKSSASGNELSASIAGGIRGFSSNLNGIPSLGAFGTATDMYTPGYDVSNRFTGAAFTRYSTSSVTTPAEEEGGQPTTVTTVSETPVITNTMSGYDSEGWFTVTYTFRASNGHNNIANGDFMGYPINDVSFTVGGGNGGAGLQDVSPFDIDDIILVKSADQKIPVHGDDVAATVAANAVTDDDDVIFSENFEDYDSGDAGLLEQGAVLDSGAAVFNTGATIYLAVDDEAFYRMNGWNTQTTPGGRDISWQFPKPVTLGPGTYKFSIDLRLSGYNPGTILASYNSDMAAEKAAVKATHSNNYVELGLMYGHYNNEGSNVNGGGNYTSGSGFANNKFAGDFKDYENGQALSTQATTLYRVGGKITADMVGQKLFGKTISENQVDPEGLDNYDPNTWNTMSNIFTVPEGEVVVLTNVFMRGGTTPAGSKDNLTANIEHRNLGYDLKNVSFEKISEDPEYTSERVDDDEALTFTEVGDDYALVEDEANWNAGKVIVRGDDENSYLAVYDRQRNISGVEIKFDGITLPAGLYNYSYDIRLASYEDEGHTMYMLTSPDGTATWVRWSKDLTGDWATMYSWAVSGDAYNKPFEITKDLTTPTLTFWADTEGATVQNPYVRPYDIDNIIIYKYVNGFNVPVAKIDFEDNNYSLVLQNDKPNPNGPTMVVEAVTETGNVIASEGGAIVYTPGETVTLSPGTYELTGNFRLSEWSMSNITTNLYENNGYAEMIDDNNERAIAVSVSTAAGAAEVKNTGDADIITEAWTPMTFEFTVAEATKLSSIVLGTDDSDMPFMADELTLTYVGITPGVTEDIGLVVDVDDTDFNVGDEVTVTVKAVTNSLTDIALNSLNFTLNYDKDIFELVSLNADAELGGNAQISGDDYGWSYPTSDDDFNGSPISTEGTGVATAKLKVKSTVADLAETVITLSDVDAHIVESTTAFEPSVVSSDEITVHNIVLTVDSTGASQPVTTPLYAKFGEATLYSDAARTAQYTFPTVTVAEGYRSETNGWLLDGEAFVPGTDTLKKAGALKFDAVRYFTLSLKVDPANGGTLTLNQITVDEGDNLLEALNAVVAENKYYTLDGWYNGNTKLTDADTAKEDLDLVAQFTAGDVNVTVNYDDGNDSFEPPVITDVTAKIGGKLTFTVPEYDGFIFREIQVSINGTDTVMQAVPDTGNKTWTSTDDITGDVVITLTYKELFEIKFIAGVGATFETVTYHAMAGMKGLHKDPMCNDTAITDIADIAYVSVSDTEKYFAVDADKPWISGETRMSEAELLAATFTADTTYTADAVKKYSVSFTFEGEGIEGLTEEKAQKVEDWYKEGDTVVAPSIVTKAHYTAAWTPQIVNEVSGAAAYVAKATLNKYGFSVIGDQAAKVTPGAGIVEEKVTYGTDVKFTIADADKLEISVTIGGEDYDVDPIEGVYTIPGADVIGNIIVTVGEVDFEIITIEKAKYGALMNGTKIILIKADDNTVTYTLEGYNFYYVKSLGGYAAIVDKDLTDGYLMSAIKFTEGKDADEVVNNGDIDGDTFITAGDAAIISEMLHNVDAGEAANAIYTDAMRLGADVYADGVVSAYDASCVLHKSVGLVYTPDDEE